MKVTLYTRVNCCLCHEAKQMLDAARRRITFELEEIDIDSDPVLRELYNEEVPVVTIDGKKAFKLHIRLEEFIKKLVTRT